MTASRGPGRIALRVALALVPLALLAPGPAPAQAAAGEQPQAPAAAAARPPAPARSAAATAAPGAASTSLLGACPAVLDDAILEGALPGVRRRIAQREPVKIVTLGSSSTSGSGATSLRYNYPSQLAVELLHRFPGHTFEVINTGVGGQEIWQMTERIDRHVLVHRPDLVIWQFGSNSALRRRTLDGIEAAARDGIQRIRASGADLIIMDLQRVPLIEASPLKEPMLALLHDVSRSTGTALFRRYDLMKAWQERLGPDYTRMFAADRLHMNDNSYYCLAASLAQGIHRLAGSTPAAPPRRPAPGAPERRPLATSVSDVPERRP